MFAKRRQMIQKRYQRKLEACVGNGNLHTYTLFGVRCLVGRYYTELELSVGTYISKENTLQICFLTFIRCEIIVACFVRSWSIATNNTLN